MLQVKELNYKDNNLMSVALKEKVEPGNDTVFLDRFIWF